MGIMIISLTGEAPGTQVVGGDAVDASPKEEATADEWRTAEPLASVGHDRVRPDSSGQERHRTMRGILAMQCLAGSFSIAHEEAS